MDDIKWCIIDLPVFLLHKCFTEKAGKRNVEIKKTAKLKVNNQWMVVTFVVSMPRKFSSVVIIALQVTSKNIVV